MSIRLAALAAAAFLAVACGNGEVGGTVGGGDGPDAGTPPAEEPDATPAPPDEGVAPAGTVPGEHPLGDGDNSIDVPAGGEGVYRIDTLPGEHTAFQLTFDEGVGGVVMAVDRWDGQEPVPLGLTDAGAGLRVLAVLDDGEERTFWVRVSADDALVDADLLVTRTPFTEGPHCSGDCVRLLQLPLPNDPLVDGYDLAGSVFRYQFGRRDMIQLIRHAGRSMIAAGRTPFRVGDVSQWDGLTPGTDVGAPRHASHQRGKDVDISLYGDDGEAPWRSYCNAVDNADGRECVPGSMVGFDGYADADLIGAYYESGRVTMCFLDRELIQYVIEGAQEAAADGVIDEALVPLYGDGHHLQHWPNHDNHVHVRLSEEDYAPQGAGAAGPGSEPGAPEAPDVFEAP